MRYRAPHRPGERPRPRRPAAGRGKPVNLRRGGALLLAAGLCAGLALLGLSIRPVLKTVSVHQANLVCTGIVNEVVTKSLAEGNVRYDSLVRLSRDAQGNVSAIETDVLSVDRLKALIATEVVDTLRSRTADQLSIPLGTLLGSTYFNARGPRVPFLVVPSQSAAVDVRGEFISAGINQTLHRILLDVDVNADAIIPGIHSNTHVSTTFLVAETVIVGQVPQAYTEVNTGETALPNAIADYGALAQAAAP